jgi:hypothetical protein
MNTPQCFPLEAVTSHNISSTSLMHAPLDGQGDSPTGADFFPLPCFRSQNFTVANELNTHPSHAPTPATLVCVVLHVAVFSGTSAKRPVSPHTSKSSFTLNHHSSHSKSQREYLLDDCYNQLLHTLLNSLLDICDTSRPLPWALPEAPTCFHVLPQ